MSDLFSALNYESPTNTEPMNEILAQLIAASIDPEKIPGLDSFDMSRRPRGQFDIVLSDTTRIRITVEDVPESLENAKGDMRR